MTTIAKKTSRGKSPLLLVVVVVLVLAVLAAMLPALLQQQRQTHSIPIPGGRGTIRVTYNDHTVESHPQDGPLVRLSCEKGPEQVWKGKYENKYSLLCQLEDGRWGVMIIQKVKGVWEEMTSFVPKSGIKEAVLRYLDSYATPFKGLLP